MKAKRFNSASAINIYNHCPRKYFMKYKLKLQEKKNLNLIVGDIVHKAIKAKADDPSKNLESLFEQFWQDAKPEFENLHIPEQDMRGYYQQYRQMVLNWEKDFNSDAKLETEVKLKSEKYQIIGVVDEISEKDGKVRILDNKTSRWDKISKDDLVQLGIYALLFQENFNKLPDYLGIRFLKTGKKQYIPIDDKLLSKAIYECQLMKVKNLSNYVNDYPKRFSGLCKWRNGQCSFYEECFQ